MILLHILIQLINQELLFKAIKILTQILQLMKQNKLMQLLYREIIK